MRYSITLAALASLAAVVFLCGAASAQAPVSIVQMASGSVLVADYVNLTRYDSDLKHPEILHPVFPAESPDKWNPTGVYEYDDNIYVANYSGHNILKGRIEGSEYKIEELIANPVMISPENVAVSTMGIAVADYDASAIHFFNHDGSLKWTRRMPVAHGVAIAYDHVYASSLTSDGILKLSPVNGDVVAQNNTYGPAGFIYPTTIVPLRDTPFEGDLAIVDANRGAVIFVDRDLKIVNSFGRNSPHLWLRPYGAGIVGSRMLVADTENRRLIWLGAGGEIAVAVDTGKRQHFGRPVESGLESALCSFDPVATPAWLPKEMSLRGGFQGACLRRNGMAARLVVFPNSSGFGLAKRPPYSFGMMWSSTITRGEIQYTVYGSPDRNVYMVTRGNDYVFATLDPKIVIWGSVGASAQLNAILDAAKPEFETFDRLNASCGRLGALLRYGELAPPLSDALLKSLTYPEAKEIARLWLSGTEVSAERVDQFVAGTGKGLEVSIDGVSILRALVGRNYQQEEEAFRNCR
jgi:hypothetical protein